MTRSAQTGKRGETAAAEHLRSVGYRIHSRNVRVGHDEIDIIAYDPVDRCLVFAEVKSRRHFDPDFHPINNLTPSKKARMQRAAQAWIDASGYRGGWRMEALCMIGKKAVEHVLLD